MFILGILFFNEGFCVLMMGFEDIVFRKVKSKIVIGVFILED